MQTSKGSRPNHDQSGASLVELLIALGLFAILGYFVSNFYNRVTHSDAELSAKSSAQAELVRLTSFLDKDLKFRELDKLVSLCANPICLNFTISRLAPGGASYNVRYSTSCKAFPASMSKYTSGPNGVKFDKNSLENLPSPATNNRTQCMRALDCAAGTYPVMNITVLNPPPGVTLPQYPTETPNLNAGRFAFNIVGAAICASQSTTSVVNGPSGPKNVLQDHIILEAAIISSANSLRIERKETVFSSNNLAKIQMLPN